MIVPLKQGLKRQRQAPGRGEGTSVEMIVPLKQGLKPCLERDVEKKIIVEMIVPLKQGLKQGISAKSD